MSPRVRVLAGATVAVLCAVIGLVIAVTGGGPSTVTVAACPTDPPSVKPAANAGLGAVFARPVARMSVCFYRRHSNDVRWQLTVLRVAPGLAGRFAHRVNEAASTEGMFQCLVEPIGRQYFLATDRSGRPMPLVSATSGGCSIAYTNGDDTRYVLGRQPAIERVGRLINEAIFRQH